ncbi:MAG TPA: LamG domain-containing protein [Kofleriaceae bacterium]
MRSEIAWLVVCGAGCGRAHFEEQRFPAACPSDPRLTACYTFAGDARDHSGYSNDATVSNVRFVSDFDGQAVETTDTSRLDIVTPVLPREIYSIDAWIRPGRFDIEQIIFDYDQHWALYLDSRGRVGCRINASQTPVSFQVATIGEWLHVACVYDGSVLQVFVAGQAEGSDPQSPPPPEIGAAAIAGNAPVGQAGPAPFVGRLDRLRIWNAALTESETCAAADDCSLPRRNSSP